ncbi:hypothetical protein E2C01_063152 [Portunus trituberculatus]|uniref:Uncharacterized protein n=1 Tax=Portunus trituberculatus TaxID=210409 RepID=A0A5B7H9Q8_PORTR|nr:hypothetical protein [Portunus trituberculatus]
MHTPSQFSSASGEGSGDESPTHTLSRSDEQLSEVVEHQTRKEAVQIPSCYLGFTFDYYYFCLCRCWRMESGRTTSAAEINTKQGSSRRQITVPWRARLVRLRVVMASFPE